MKKKWQVHLTYLASITHEVEAENAAEAVEKAEQVSPYSDEALENVEFSLRPVDTEIELDES